MTLPPSNFIVLAVGLQCRLMPEIDEGEGIVASAQRLLMAAGLLGRRTIFAELDYSAHGETLPSLKPYGQATLQAEGFDATRPQCFRELVPPAITEVLLLGAEAQASILQTGLALLKMGKSVLIAADAVGAHRDFEKRIALSRLAQKGAEIVSVEMVVYEWLGTHSAQDIARITKLIRRPAAETEGISPAQPPQLHVDGVATEKCMPLLEGIGPQLRRSRTLRGLTLKEVATRCECSSSQLSKIENSKAFPSLPLLHKLSEVLGSDLKSLLGN